MVACRFVVTFVVSLAVVAQLAGQSTTRASVGSNGQESVAPCLDGSISADGRYVAFSACDGNLVSQVWAGILVRDRCTQELEMVSVSTAGVPANLPCTCRYPALSADERFVAFTIFASNLVGGDTNSCTDVFVRDRVGGITTLVSKHPSGSLGNN